MRASWVAYYGKHSPEVRPTKVLLPERFAFLLAPSALRIAYRLVISPLVLNRFHEILNLWLYYVSKLFYEE